HGVEPGISATEFQFHHSRPEPGSGPRRLWIFIRTSTEKGGGWRLLQTNPTTKKVEWVDSQVTAYLTKERQFLRKLMWLSRPGGQPARGPELGSIKSNRDPVFSAGSTICSSIGSSGVGVFVWDLRGPWAGEELSQALGSATRKHLGVYLRASGWRHTAIGIATRYLMRASKTWEKEHEDPEDGGDEFAEGDDDEELELDTFRHIMVRQSGHGRRVAQAHYAIDGAFLHRLGPELITAYEQASTAWHGLWKLSSHGVGSRNSSRIGGVSHRRDASQQLSNRIIKRGRIESSDPALVGLQRIYHDPQAKPRSEGQASALQLTVVVVVPFAALVDDIIERGRAAGLDCTEWIDETSGHELSQLIVVSADRAVQGPFLHYAKGLELGGQLAHVFFDEVHVAFTDTSYRERLRDLWTLRYLDCPFTGLTATLIVDLEDVLRERLCKRGVIYVRSYETGRAVSDALACPFYRARAELKGEVLQWVQGPGGWIAATGALGTGINIEGIIYVVHVGRPYGLTSFVQQSGRGGRNGEVSESIIITRVEHSRGRRRREIMSEYSVEQIDEDAMTEFIQAPGVDVRC
ncbi:hypothetical protein H4I95_12202, partial [Botrytis cinerea]